MNVYLIEDNAVDAKIVINMLKEWHRYSFNVYTDDSLDKVTDVIKDKKIDIILLDLTLVSSSKDETIRRIKELSSAVPVVIITSSDEEEDIKKVFDLGAQEYLIKFSFNKELLIRTLDYSLQRWRFNEKLYQHTKQIKKLEKSQLYLDIAGVFILSLNSHGNVTLINKKGCDILGFKKEEILGKNWFEEFIPDNLKDDVKVIFDNIIKGQQEGVYEHENLIKVKGGQRLMHWDNIYLKDNKGKIIGTLSSGQDITAQSQSHENLKGMIEDLKTYKSVTLGRENVMIELKKEVNQLSKELGKTAPYDLSFL